MKTFHILYFDLVRLTKDDIIWGLLECGQDVKRAGFQAPDTVYTDEELQKVLDEIGEEELIISQNFSAVIAEACHQKSRLYLSWVYDSPQASLYMKEALYDTNLIFLFDRKQIERLRALGISNVFYQPLAANITRMATLVLTDEEIEGYRADAVFVGSLYKDPARKAYLQNLPPEFQSLTNELIAKDEGLWNRTRHIFDPLPEEAAEGMHRALSQKDMEAFRFPKEYLVQTLVLSHELAEHERTLILQNLSEVCSVHLYTNDVKDGPELRKVIFHGGIDPAVEVYKLYYSARMNLNHFLPSIETGVSQRVFDILSVGGFLLTTDQEELHELFIPDKELVVFSDLEELKEKAAFYLNHEDLRIRIGVEGYQKVRSRYTYPVSLKRMLTFVERFYS